MEKWIKSIKGTIPHTNKTVDIKLDGKNLIVTGVNGSGKTSFIKTLDLLISHIIIKSEIGLTTFEKTADNLGKKDSLNQKKIIFDFVKEELFEKLHKENKAILKFYEEKRLSEIKQPKTGKQVYANGNDLEQHLLNLVTRQSFALTQHLFLDKKEIEENKKLAKNIQNWFNDFENNLKTLFEDESVKLKFDPNTSHFSIIQKDKLPFSFQTLSAGYRAIFDIYADLLMHTEYFKIMPNELTGIVLIDEIDSHLHVSLQRLILPFFTQSFPKIQFIVTTHSPFVLMSTPDAVVFDLAKNEAITDDLSYYTYSAVMKGLWNIKPISIHLENSIKEISKITNSERKDYKRLKELVEATRPYEDALDSESKVFLLLGIEALEEGGKNV